MGGKNDGKDPFADFFGDDVDWLDDEEVAARRAAPPPTMPPSQAPPPTLPPAPAPRLAEPDRVGELPPPVPPPPPPPIRPPVEAFLVAPTEPEGAALDEPMPFVAAPTARSAVEETVGVFLEPISLTDAGAETHDHALASAIAPIDDMVTVTDDGPSRPVLVDDIVVEEDAPEDIAAATATAEPVIASVVAEPEPTVEAFVGGALASPPPSPEPEPAGQLDADAPHDSPSAVAPSATAAEAPAEVPAPADPDPAPDRGPRPLPDLAEPSEEQARAVSADPSAAAEQPAVAPAAPVVPPLETWRPGTVEDLWQELCEPIEALADETADPAAQAALLLEAARIRRDRLGQVDAARALLDRAVATGATDPTLLAAHSETASRGGDFARAAEALVERAGLLEGAAAAESWQAAALIARHRLREVESAERCLRGAVTADAGDYASLSLLRDHLTVKGRESERAEVLGQLSALADGRVAAEAWWELGRLQLALDDPEAASRAFASGRACDPTQAQCFLALQALLAHLGDDVGLGELYASEGARCGGADAAHWAIEAARCFVEARDVDRADAAFERAVALDHPLARREQQAWLLATGRPGAYVDALRAEIAATDEAGGRAYALYRLGWALEDALSDPGAAVAAYREAVALDPAAGPAAEAVARVLQASGAHAELLEFWQRRLEGSDDPTLRSSVLLRMAEVAEARLGDDARARTYLEQLVALAPDDRTALDALRRIYRRLKAWPELATVYETLAGAADGADERAYQLARAGNVWRYEVRDPERARDCYARALELRPAHGVALDEHVDLLEELGLWSEQALVLRAASDAARSEQDKVRLAYRAGRVWLDRLDDGERAAEAFRHCLRYQPGFLPALGMLKQLAARSNQGQEIYRLYLQQAQSLEDPAARHWRLLAAADLAERLPGGDPGRDLGAILERAPTHAGAVAAQELRLLALGAKVGLLNLYRRLVHELPEGGRRVALRLRVAGLYEALGDDGGVAGPLAEAVGASVDETPYRALARLCEARRMWPEAVDALARASTPEDDLERARLLTVRLKQLDEAMGLYERLLDDPDTAVGAALGAAALAQRLGNSALLYRAHATLARDGGTEGVRAAHALWSGQLAEAATDADAALGHYRDALALRPASIAAFDGARRLLLRAADVAGIASLWRTHRASDHHGLALDLEQLGAWGEVVQTLREAVEASPTPGPLAELEVALARVEDWRAVYEIATRRAALAPTASSRAAIDAKRRWLLGEKLFDTDEAWTLYQALHEENPDDREVASALARIALARGEARLAAGYLEHLAQGAASPREAADLRVRVAEVHLRSGATADARQALLDALDHVPDHAGALGGLKDLARSESDGAALIDVLKIEAAHARGDDRIALLREIARETELHVGDPAVSAEAWQSVLDLAPEDPEALDRAVDLAARAGAWSRFVELAPRLAEQRSGEERSSLLARAGAIALDELEQPGGVELLERALREDPQNGAAADRLVSLYRARAQSDDIIRLLVAQSAIGDDPAASAARLAEAADLRKRSGDRDGAAELYQRAVALAPDARDPLIFLAEYYFERGQTEGALPVYERLAPMIEEGQDLDDFDVRMELTAFFYRLARMLADQGRPGDAIAHGERALTYNPTHQPTLDLLAPLLLNAERWKRAGDVLRQLLQLTGGLGDKPRVALTYARLGQVERAQGRAEKARKHLEKALDLAPNHIVALQGLAGLHEDAGQWTQLLDVYNSVISHATQPADVTGAYLTKGRVLDEQMARPDKAAQHYERSLAYDANQPGVLLRLAELAWRRGDFDEVAARAQLALGLVFQPGPLRADLHVCLAAARLSQGDADRSRQALEQARADDPSLTLPDGALDDLDALRVQIRGRLPR